MTYSLTNEQQAVVNADLSAGTCTHVLAFAGAGKTSTLVKVAEKYLADNKGAKVLYLAFNKSIQTEASSKFPAGVTCKTTHSLAFKACGVKYASAKQLGENRLNVIASACKSFGELQYPVARATQQTVRNFMYSADPAVALKHVPFNLAREGVDTEEMTRDQVDALRVQILERATAFWGAMINLDNAKINLPHDGYLKLFQLEGVQLGYDLVMMDESQDANGATVGILKNQKNTAIVMVGDKHQAIYQFRGSSNAFGMIPATSTYHLSESFRFGPAVAGVANALLSGFKGETVKVKGHKEGDAVVSFIPEGESLCQISRTNTVVFESALSAMSNGQSVAVVGGANGLKFSVIEDALCLLEGDKWSAVDPFFKGFEDYDAFTKYVKQDGDAELTRVVRIISEHGSALRGLIKMVKEGLVDMRDADVVLTTAHKSKGLEFENVVLADDFSDLVDEDGEPRDLDDASINLLYVACTRAEKRLVLNTSLMAIA